MKKFVLLIVVCVIGLDLTSQILPRWATEDEKQLLPHYLESFSQKQATSPPNFEVRNMAEWEEAEYLVVTWTGFPAIIREIVRHGKEAAKVIVVCADSNQVKTYLQNGGVTLSNIQYLEESFNSIWIRDYFGNTGYKNGSDSLLMVDWVYNRPRPADDQVAHKVASLLNIPIYETAANPNRLVHTGGNYMSDGKGYAFSSDLVLDENTNKTEAQINDLMGDYLGVSQYAIMDKLPYDGIHHIDMHMKLMNENTLLIGEYPAGISDGPQIEANINYVLSNYVASDGSPYRIERIDMPKNGSFPWPSQGGNYYTYTNMLFVNGTVLVPVYNLPTDDAALDRIRALMPGYKVVGIDCSSIIPLGGAIHCITHTIGVSQPLVVNHYPIPDQEDNGNDYLVTASAQHLSGIQDLTLHWTTDTTQGFQELHMGIALSGSFLREATIPNQPAGTTVYYYIEAEAQNGKIARRPFTAPAGFYAFDVLPFTSVNEKAEQQQITRVFPNPASAITAVEFNGEIDEAVSLSLFNTAGQIVFSTNQTPFAVGTGKSQLFFDASQFDAGIYLIEIKTESHTQTQQLIIN